MTTCKNPLIFSQMSTDKAYDIEEIFRGTNLYPIITETQTVPTSTPRVANKITTAIKDFAESVELSKDLFDKPSYYCRILDILPITVLV